MQAKTWIMMLILAICCVCCGCAAPDGNADAGVDTAAMQPEEIVAAVLENMLAMPADDMAALARDSISVIGLGAEEDEAARRKQEAAQEALDALLREQYAPYFTEAGLTEFIGGKYSGLQLHLFLPVMYEPAPVTSLAALQLMEAGEESPGAYRFDATVLCQLDGAEQEAAVTGYAYFAEGNRINRFSMADSSALAVCLREMAK